jgi:CheY-like chemotaxis protein
VKNGNTIVLYVEDEECDLLFMQAAFDWVGRGEALRSVGDGREAMDYLDGRGHYADRERYPLPSVVMLDLNLPVCSGFEVLRWIKQRPELNSLPVIVFSSSTRPDDKAKAIELGADGYLEKPTSGMKFRDVVAQLMEKWSGLL